MRRVALLGATGSIGRQAIEVVASHPGLQLCAVMSGSTRVDEIATKPTASSTRRSAATPSSLLERAEPDVVLNAIVGFAGVRSTLWALERGVTLALANKESLVAAGSLALAAQERGGGLLLPVDSEHSALYQCLEGRDPETVDSLVLTASGGPFRGRSRDELETVSPAEALAASHVAHGSEDHDRLGDAREQGPRADRGTLAVRSSRTSGSRSSSSPSSIVHALVRFRDGALLAHLGMPDMRVPISFALTHPERARRPSTRSTSQPG